MHTHAPFPVGYVIQPQYVSYREGCVYACDRTDYATVFLYIDIYRTDYATVCISQGGVTM